MDARSPDPGSPVLSPVVPQRVLMGILWSGAVFSIITVSVRLIMRWKLLRKFKADDYLVIAALVFSTSGTITWTVVGGNIYLMLNPAFDVDGKLDFLENIAIAMHGNLSGYICFWSCLWSIKLSFMAFFHGLGKQIRSQRILWWGIMIFTVASYVVCIGTLPYGCLAATGTDLITKCMDPASIEYEYASTRSTTTLDILTDVLIVILSTNIIWRARIPWKKKLVLASICSLTVAMVVIAIVRITVGSPGKIPDLAWLLLWNSVEMTLAIFVACIASFRSLYCQTRDTNRPSEPVSPHPPKKPSARGLFNSTFGTDTILADETTHWAPQENMRTNSQENLCASDEAIKAVTVTHSYSVSSATADASIV